MLQLFKWCPLNHCFAHDYFIKRLWGEKKRVFHENYYFIQYRQDCLDKLNLDRFLKTTPLKKILHTTNIHSERKGSYQNKKASQILSSWCSVPKRHSHSYSFSSFFGYLFPSWFMSPNFLFCLITSMALWFFFPVLRTVAGI